MIHLEGNIGAGKSTLGEQLAASGGYTFLPEPVAIWQSDFPENLLDLFYSDTKRWGFLFQLAAFTTRAKTWDEILKMSDSSAVILERSIFSDYNIFARNCHETGLITDTEWAVYEKLWTWLSEQWCEEPGLILYLRTPAKVCRERIIKRDRIEENDAIPLEYLKQLEKLHDEWLLHNPGAIVLDGEKSWDMRKINTLIGYKRVAYTPPAGLGV